jgi:hypothetical protein
LWWVKFIQQTHQEFYSKKEWAYVFRPLGITFHDLRLSIYAMPYAPFAKRDVGKWLLKKLKGEGG